MTAMGDMEVQVSAETRAALKADLTCRWVLRTKHHRDMSRRSADVIPCAQSVVERLSSAVVQESGQQTAGFSVQLNIVQMLGLRNLVYICGDLFLDECDERLRTEITEDFHTKRPVHYIIQKRNRFFMYRDERVDDKVARQYLDMSSIDKGPRPLFSDLENPPFYNQHGQRIENWQEYVGAPPEATNLLEAFAMKMRAGNRTSRQRLMSQYQRIRNNWSSEVEGAAGILSKDNRAYKQEQARQ